MSVSDLDQEWKPRPRFGRALWAAAMLLGLALISLETPTVAAHAPPAASSLPAEMARSETPALPPSTEITSSIGTLAAQQRAQASAIPVPERIILIGLLAVCFGVMAFGGFRLWRRSVDDLIRSREDTPGQNNC
jgi:hypothetical protein